MKSGLKDAVTPHNAKTMPNVATIAAMKSGLKVKTVVPSAMDIEVATIAAMKSGLKDVRQHTTNIHFRVATIAAMKSGLKA